MDKETIVSNCNNALVKVKAAIKKHHINIKGELPSDEQIIDKISKTAFVKTEGMTVDKLFNDSAVDFIIESISIDKNNGKIIRDECYLIN